MGLRVEFRKKSDIKWVKEASISAYHLICADYDTYITIKKGDLFMHTPIVIGGHRFATEGTDSKKWYLTDGWYTFYNMPFDTLADAKAYAVREYIKGNLNGASELKKYNPNSYLFRKE